MQGRRGLILFELRPSSSTPSMASAALTLPVASLRLRAVVGGGTDGRIPRLPPQEAGCIDGGWPALRSCSSSSAMACPGPRARRSLVAWSPPAAVSSNRVLNQDGMAPRHLLLEDPDRERSLFRRLHLEDPPFRARRRPPPPLRLPLTPRPRLRSRADPATPRNRRAR